MKAESAVLVQVQRPMTLLGLSMPLMAFVVATGVVLAVAAILAVSFALMLPAAGAGFVGAWLFFFRRVRGNPHYDRDLTVGPRFWRGRRERHLAAGGPR